MKYMGSKNRIAKDILPLILSYHKEEQVFLDACVGGANLLDKIPAKIKRYGNDINPYLIKMWKAVSCGWVPPETFTEEAYKHLKENKDSDPVLAGYVGFALSYGGKWWGGWCRDSQGKRDYVAEAYRNAMKQFPKLRGVSFFSKNITTISPKQPSLIYCDIPYKNTTKYASNFNHDKFYTWCRDTIRNNNNTVLISEYTMPSDFVPIWSKEIKSSLTSNTGAKVGKEKLFVHMSQLKR